MYSEAIIWNYNTYAKCKLKQLF